METVKITNNNLSELRYLVKKWNDYKAAGVSDSDNPIQFYSDKTIVEVYEVNNKDNSQLKRTNELKKVYDYSEVDSFYDDFPLLNTTNVETIDSMFNTCLNLKTTHDLKISNVESMESIFCCCENLQNTPQNMIYKLIQSKSPYINNKTTKEKHPKFDNENDRKPLELNQLSSTLMVLTTCLI